MLLTVALRWRLIGNGGRLTNQIITVYDMLLGSASRTSFARDALLQAAWYTNTLSPCGVERQHNRLHQHEARYVAPPTPGHTANAATLVARSREPETRRERMAMSANARAARRRVWLKFGAAVGILAVLVALVVTLWPSGTPGDDPMGGSGTTTPSTSAPTAAVANNPACNGFTVKLDPHTDGSVISGGIPAHLSAGDKKAFVAQKAKEDPTVLQPYFNESPLVKSGIKPAITDPAALAPMKNGECWKPEGIELYNAWSALWSVTDVTPVPLPATGTNTGGQYGASSYQMSGPIPAGTATRFTYKDANGKPNGISDVRNECGNPVSSKPMRGLPSRPAPPTGTGHRPPPPPRSTPPPPPPPPPPTTTQPPPPCDRPCCEGPCDEGKDPSEGSDPNGNAGPGSGQNEDPTEGEFLPPTYAPETPRVDPPPPAPEPGQDGGTPTSVVAPPPAPDVAPTPGQEGSDDGAVAGPEEGEEEFVPPADW